MSLKDKVVGIEEALQRCKVLREKGKQLVFTNGCFDILHKGHVLNLEQAANLGDCLIVGLNSDASVKRLKGESRPYQNQDSRAIVLAALESVSLVILFEEDTPEKLIRVLNPQVLAKGGDYTLENIAGASHVIANGGRVVTLPLTEGHSTTNIVNKATGGNSNTH